MPYVKRVEPSHSCSPPKIMGEMSDWETPTGDLLTSGGPKLREGVRLPQEGDVWACPDCYKTWVCYWDPGEITRGFVRMGRREWRPERKRERRRRERKS